MTIKELIEKLQKMPQEYTIQVFGFLPVDEQNKKMWNEISKQYDDVCIQTAWADSSVDVFADDADKIVGLRFDEPMEIIEP